MLRSSLFWSLLGIGVAAAAAALLAGGLALPSDDAVEAAWPAGSGRALLVGIGAALVVSAALGYRLAHRLGPPLRSMTAAAEAVAAGEDVRRVPVASSGEVGRLSRAFDTMAGELSRRLDTITTERNRMQAVLEGMVEGVVAVDRDERLVHMNAVAERLLRVSIAPTPGQRIWEITRRREVSEILTRAMMSGEKVSGELHPVPSPEARIVDMEASPLRDGRGQIAGAVVVLHDVTELRALETVRRDFVANVSHELKTPLTAIRGMVETMVEDPEMDGGVRTRFLARVQDQCGRLSALVVDLLVLSRLESEGRREREELDLARLVEECGREQRADADAVGVRLEVEVAADPVPVDGDEEDLRTLITNLVGNAIQYTPVEGTVTLRLLAGEGAAVLEVADTGIGIEPRDRERVFERFYRVDKARSRELGGTGLGLSIVKHVARSHHGDVELESIPGRGSTFRVNLPLARGSAGA